MDLRHYEKQELAGTSELQVVVVKRTRSEFLWVGAVKASKELHRRSAPTSPACQCTPPMTNRSVRRCQGRGCLGRASGQSSNCTDPPHRQPRYRHLSPFPCSDVRGEVVRGERQGNTQLHRRSAPTTPIPTIAGVKIKQTTVSHLQLTISPLSEFLRRWCFIEKVDWSILKQLGHFI